MNPDAVIAQPELWVWLAPDWSDYQPGDKAPAGKTGWTRVKIRETRYADGRIVRNVLNEGGQPIAADGTAATAGAPGRPLDATPEFDKEQERRFKEQQATGQRGDQEGDIRGSQTGPTREVYRGGKWVVEPNPVYQAPSNSQATTGRVEGTPLPGGGHDNTKPIWVERDASGQQVGPAKPLTADQRQQWEREKNPGGKTDAELREPPKPRQSRVNPSDPTKMQEFDPTSGSWVDAGVNAAGAQAAADRNKPVPKQDENGNWGYWDTAKTPPVWTPIQGGPQTAPKPVQVNGQWGVWKPGANGAAPTFERVEAPADLNNPTAPAPRMPNFVLGGSQAALTEYKAQLQQGVSSGLWSQKWADDRWGEAVQMAQQVNQDYATQQREIESTRNAEINLAQGRATLGQNAITTALEHVNKINGSLPEGSPLGGQTFAALLGMNMLMQARSGIDSIDVRARPQQQVPAITPAEMRDPVAMQARRSEVSSQITASLGAPPFVQQPAAPVQPAQPTPSAATPAAPVGAASAGPARPAAPMLPEAVPGGGPPAPTGAPGFGAPAELPEATPGGGPPPPPPMPAQPTPMSQPETFAPGQFPGGSVLPQTPPEQPYVPVHEWQPAQPFNDDPTQGPVGQAPVYPVLASASSPTMPAPQPAPTPEQPYSVLAGATMPTMQAPVQQPTPYPAMQQVDIAGTPPWQLSAADYERAVAEGREDQFWSVPGRRVA